MTEEQRLVRAFHDRFLRDNRQTPALRDEGMLDLRVRLLEEETREFAEAARSRDLVEMADALADVLYVILGTANVLGIDLEPIFKEVHRSNMTKRSPGNTPAKAVKGEDWSPPDIRAELLRQGWKPNAPA
jgi:predicted HAD superfamily Cof-like phosphohydrolase